MRTSIDAEGGLVLNGQTQVLVHGHLVETGDLGLEGLKHVRRHHNVGLGVRAGAALPGRQAELVDDSVEPVRIAANIDAEDLVAAVRLARRRSLDGSRRGKGQKARGNEQLKLHLGVEEPATLQSEARSVGGGDGGGGNDDADQTVISMAASRTHL